MRVIEYGNAVWRDIDHFIDRVSETFNRLVRQAVDQIEIYASKIEFASPFDGLPRDLFRLNAVDGCLHLGIEILHTEACTVKPYLSKSCHVFASKPSRVNLDTGLNIRVEFE